jgi:hypothetical protein
VVKIATADPNVVYVPVYEPVSEPPAEPVSEEPSPGEPSTNVTTTTTVYYPSNVAYSEPYTPYYDATATFWTGALVGGLTMGFLMNWDDDDIDIDIDEGEFEDWRPGRGDMEDANIANEINIGNGVEIGKGDSWRKMREQKTGGDQVSQLKSTRPTSKAAQPAASAQAKVKAQKPAAASTVKKKPAAAGNAQIQKTNKTVSKQPVQKAGALGNVERGQNTVKASNRGAASQQKALKQQPKGQQAAPTKSMGATGQSTSAWQGNQSAFGNMSSGRQTEQFSSRGASSQKIRSRR